MRRWLSQTFFLAFLSTQSGFARTVTAQRRIGSRIEALRGCVYTETTPEGTNVTELTERDAWWDVVITHFGLDYHDLPADERETLWRQTLDRHRAWRAGQDD